MRFAVDVDRTIYDTESCVRAMIKDACAMSSSYEERLKALSDLYTTEPKWFDPAYLIPEAVSALRQLSREHEIYICTMRDSDRINYTSLIEALDIPVDGIWQAKDYANKAEACFFNEIDYLIDDGASHLEGHYWLCDNRPDTYKTKFILYGGFAVTDFIFKPRYFSLQHADRVALMSSWNELPDIIRVLSRK